MQNEINKTIKLETKKNINNKNLVNKTFYSKSVNLKNKKIKSKYSNPLYFFIKNKYKKQYNYSKLTSYSKEKFFFIKEIKNYKDNKRMINSDKINKFHHIYIHSKMKSYSESPDNNELTSNNKTTNISDATISNNLSKNKYPILKSTNFQDYRSNSNKTRNKILFNINNSIKTEIDKLHLTTNYNGFSLIKSKNKDENKYLTINKFLENKKLNICNERGLLQKKDKNRTFLTENPPTKVLNYKFNDVIGTLNNNVYCEGKLTSSRGIRNGLTEQILSKFRYNLINKIKKEFYDTQYEIHENPLIIIKEFESFQKTNKNYYNIYLNLIKKYFGYLYAQINEEKYKLVVLNEQREKLKEDIFQLMKKINIQNEKISFYQNFMKLLVRIKYNTISLDILPDDYLQKYGIVINGPRTIYNKNNINKKFVKKKTQIMITEPQEKYKPRFKRKTTINLDINQRLFSRTSSNNYNEIYKMNKELKKKKSKDISPKKSRNYYTRKRSADYEISKKIPIFNTVEELSDRLKGIEIHLKDLFKESSDKRYMIQILKTELYREGGRNKTHKFIESNNELESLKHKLVKRKEQYLLYTNFKKVLIDTKNNNYIEYKPQIIEKHDIKENDNKDEKDEKNKKVSFADKIISILLKLDVNIEEMMNCPGVYTFLKTPQEIKINNHGKEYMKTLFCIKILEIVFLKLMEKRRKYLSNDKTRKHYLELEEIIDRNNKIMKVCEKREEEVKERIKRQKEILIKSTKVPILPIKRDDPFSYKIYYEQFKKKEKERIQELKKKDEIDEIFKNFISY